MAQQAVFTGKLWQLQGPASGLARPGPEPEGPVMGGLGDPHGPERRCSALVSFILRVPLAKSTVQSPGPRCQRLKSIRWPAVVMRKRAVPLTLPC